mmetsp:Transcript_840/g.1480  ORF Transcript_840/g.1480 Transcript_840/m.1480 type:complete len:258 (-) Transcript_840:121-894(-)|eukprot:CAMPEP_0198212414 /NCGR_PEP_ID=MMETSP1445-20131203/25961_1 /TAXON_ID=36898 /ORGANISM="Pyramimonas sp., Strain CCMP2087" /LENGTH=257 /DNA_ID=CAMNT_0043886847 /DNA_START=91 /DNA_END=864 /DNA_ORIENTATION=+
MDKVSIGNATIPVTAASARPSGKPVAAQQKQPGSKVKAHANVRINNKRRPNSAARRDNAGGTCTAVAGGGTQETPRPGDPSFKPNPADLKTLNEIVSIGKWDKVEEKVKDMAMKNEVTEGLLEAAVHLITVCQQMDEASQVTETLEKVANLIAFCLQTSYMPPVVKLMDDLMKMDPVSQQALVKSRMIFAFNSDVNKEDFVKELEGMIEQMDEQNGAMQVEFDQAAAAQMPVTNMMAMLNTRRTAVERMQTLLALSK